ncbi:UDP-N-acetylglucosamine transferase subunit ALG13 [Anoxybacillus kamchatkensis]|uniref:PssE/Cps14G family polysaccharide biosynthesis glycosyltransferase n=1 Tax=Anoxybacillus ayderensis TaxID=265546 RepID=UPI0015EC8583|nr:PssE/Cps14G family polysaccharide biosynthesis glycosyltransferase [Anoxybacillus ayderensis]MBA2877149.1 UDP-N-acetylglucosamine transferase subunit ALG13 [Anoxybacillus ayderensis]
MIFVTVGTQRFPFDRLFKKLDELVEQNVIRDSIVAQVGYTQYTPKHFRSFPFISAEEMEKYIQESDLIITHSGTSSIIKCLKYGKKVVVVPRLAKYKEHVDDHQLEIAQLFAAKNFIEPVYHIEELGEKIEKAKVGHYASYNFDNSRLLQSISNYLDELNKDLK